MTGADEWVVPVDGQEAGLNYSDLGEGVRLFDVRGAWSDGFGDSGPVEKIGFAVHHAVTGVGDGSIAGDLAIIQAIHAYHTNNNGWPGIGYHRIIGASRRVYLIANSASQRAHVANLNHQWIGWCFLGTWTFNRPDEDRMAAFRRGTQWETDQRQVPMLLAPHKRLTPGTECPGGWAAQDAWTGTTLQPAVPTSAPIPGPGPDDFQRGRREVSDARDQVDAVHRAQRAELEVRQRAEIESLPGAWGIP